MGNIIGVATNTVISTDKIGMLRRFQNLSIMNLNIRDGRNQHHYWNSDCGRQGLPICAIPLKVCLFMMGIYLGSGCCLS
jgi:hypothetical protein